MAVDSSFWVLALPLPCGTTATHNVDVGPLTWTLVLADYQMPGNHGMWRAEKAAAGANEHLELELQCNTCEWTVTPQRWRLDGVHDKDATEAGVPVVAVYGNPEWATEFAVQGCEQVTRYVCPECFEVLAVLADHP